MKILILKPSSLGDVIHALPVLRLLKLHFPKGEIYWWLDAALVPLLEKDPDLSGIIPLRSLDDYLSTTKFPVRKFNSDEIVVSRGMLPAEPTVYVLKSP